MRQRVCLPLRALVIHFGDGFTHGLTVCCARDATLVVGAIGWLHAEVLHGKFDMEQHSCLPRSILSSIITADLNEITNNVGINF